MSFCGIQIKMIWDVVASIHSEASSGHSVTVVILIGFLD